jgi:uncharacterized protein with HEPN domain
MTGGDARKYLWDAQQAVERIAKFTRDRRIDDYFSDDMLRAAVERQFEIIGEALVGLRRVEPAIAQQIPDLLRIIAFRNILIHGYASVDDRLVWGVVEADLPLLRDTLDRLLA